MAASGVTEQVERFVFRLLGVGLALSDLVADLAEGLPADAYPGEEPTAVVLEMLCGTIATAFGPDDAPELDRATELIELAHTRTIEHLHLTVALSERIHGEDGAGRRSHG